jgi:hypothetical protein
MVFECPGLVRKVIYIGIALDLSLGESLEDLDAWKHPGATKK